jgi:ribosomal protein S18 acetylase RimI-like enzyme
MAVTTPTIRRAALADLDAVLPLVRAYRAFYKREPDAERERNFVEAHLRDGTSAIYIAEVHGAAAGFMQLFKSHSTVHLAPSWILEDLFVEPAYRRSGIAGALLRRALEHAREDGAAGMFLETANDNVAAQAVYENAGWTREGRFIKYNAPLG